MDVDNILVKNSYNNLIKIFFIWKFNIITKISRRNNRC